jgi:hypothetical protein
MQHLCKPHGLSKADVTALGMSEADTEALKAWTPLTAKTIGAALSMAAVSFPKGSKKAELVDLAVQHMVPLPEVTVSMEDETDEEEDLQERKGGSSSSDGKSDDSPTEVVADILRTVDSSIGKLRATVRDEFKSMANRMDQLERNTGKSRSTHWRWHAGGRQ